LDNNSDQRSKFRVLLQEMGLDLVCRLLV
jgi:hypothetical protein